jgi:hypothetical protein
MCGGEPQVYDELCPVDRFRVFNIRLKAAGLEPSPTFFEWSDGEATNGKHFCCQICWRRGEVRHAAHADDDAVLLDAPVSDHWL